MQKRVTGGTWTVPLPKHTEIRMGTLQSMIRKQVCRDRCLKCRESPLLASGWRCIHKPTNAHLLGLLNQTLDPGESEVTELAIELGANHFWNV
jgi:hypothetical protein